MKVLDIAVIGAGPHALTLVLHLLQKRRGWHDRIRAFDPSGTWLHQWQHQFAALQIPHLRSPIVHHPCPNPFALRQFAELRPEELHAPYDLPGTQLFNDFCDHLVQTSQLQDQVVPEAIRGLEYDRLRRRFHLQTSQRETVSAKRVVLACGGGTAAWPHWAKGIQQSSYPPDRLQHSSQVDLRETKLSGQHVLIVGSGLTSGHLAIGALRQGATVTMLARRSFYAKLFDADPGWLGPKLLRGFNAEPCWQTRWHQVTTARNGGSLTPTVLRHLRRYAKTGQLQLQENCIVQSARWQENHWNISCHNEKVIQSDYIWAATGSNINISSQPLLKSIAEQLPIQTINGLPVLTQNLRWGDIELYIMGGLAALQIGPTARNLSGARMASDRIVDALAKPRRYQPLIAA
ncbi:SidA/IucD/PvdA family monooxygenase [filamentous cyanobacterium LEGE 11480]|uniref:SidA/IucD/PvdA family monooxygenase n=1 Tax=Romeriopsis navalis LEGE 11480 TaxID=2777977 RepID=A0A928Z143_9CYAN|nr:lysine N(6)-hydroxylase/L-ornithine N(5)-oxygenase family protein [Romeriopsis navalis]MBE9028936.1 SidA/IucD/PvdA family monooxygenase [Romeriopsis navalis LEGE 11480]